MRIIKEGREPKKEIEQTCERCGCVFAYSKEDIERECPNVVGMFIHVVCPHCGAQIEVEPWNGY